jgi:hypothetical protein
MLTVRETGSDHADAAVNAVRESSTKSCVADRRGDPITIERWLRNKTAPHFLSWLDDPDNFSVIAVERRSVWGSACCAGSVKSFFERGHSAANRSRRQHEFV